MSILCCSEFRIPVKAFCYNRLQLLQSKYTCQQSLPLVESYCSPQLLHDKYCHTNSTWVLVELGRLLILFRGASSSTDSGIEDLQNLSSLSEEAMFPQQQIRTLISFLTIVLGHTVITYPGWREDNLITNETFPYGMQWMYPCKCFSILIFCSFINNTGCIYKYVGTILSY